MKVRKSTPPPRYVFYVRLTEPAEQLRRKLQRQLGGPSNAVIAERALQALAAELSEKRHETSAAA